jgi:hypothetical protein
MSEPITTNESLHNKIEDQAMRIELLRNQIFDLKNEVDFWKDQSKTPPVERYHSTQTLRLMLAGSIAQGIYANSALVAFIQDDLGKRVAEISVNQADLLLKEITKTGEQQESTKHGAI